MQLLIYSRKTLNVERVRASTEGLLEVTNAPNNIEQYIIMHTNHISKQNIQNQE